VIPPEADVPGRRYYEYMNDRGYILLVPVEELEK
jgi:hypothetical protein